MARRALAIAPGLGAAALAAALVLVPLAAVFLRAEIASPLAPSDWAALRFTVMQAVLSAALSVLLAIPLARALARRRFPGRAALLALLGAPFILPTIVAVLGLLAVFGRAGLLSQALGLLGLPPVQIYGLHGIVLAHVFFNLPLATRLILQGWLAVPAERFRLAASLGLGASDINRLIERPILRATLPGAFLVIFLVCTTSFAVALALGGGPRATTVELAIYQAFAFDFDTGRAARLAALQFAIAAVAAAAAFRLARFAALGGGLDRPVERWDARTPFTRAQDATLIAAAALFLLIPLAMIVARGATALPSLPTVVWEAALRSLAVALASALLATAAALAIALAVQRLARAPAALVEGAGYAALAVSPLVIGTGLFILLFPIADPFALALPVTALINALMSLPFLLRALVPAVAETEARFGPLADSLGLTGSARLRLLLFPRLRRPLGFSLGLSAALSMGDLGVVALFAPPGGGTLPLELYRLMGAYRMDDAAGAALLLLVLSLALFWVFDRGGRADARA
jgi:thiamine transport system permease protein